ncbi:phosphatase PAP2 family protein [Gilliamella sp. Nev5-1]|uniref:phosphatase PAP2 family protein n=1 Tax=Gilliamella sp. Nev5-1 TaxID=3120251 RepID=UPI001C53F0CD|nr:phosphatase PAP2 family protein [Gilliamella apicola]
MKLIKPCLMRLAYLLLGWLSVGVFYRSAGELQGEPTLLTPSIIDQSIAFTPHAIWFYLSFFLIIPICFLVAPYHRLLWMSICFILSGFLAGICYLIFPTSMDFPVDTGTSISSWLLAKLIDIDVPVNCFPSLHITLTLLAIWGSLDKCHPQRNILLVLWGIAIAFSIIQLRRHLFVDFLGGIALALMVGYGVRYGSSYLIKQNLEQ